MHPTGTLQPGISQPSMLASFWPIIVVDWQGLFFLKTIPVHCNKRKGFFNTLYK